MFFRRLGFRLPFRIKAVAEEDSAIDIEESDEDIDKAADALLTLMVDGEGRSTTEPSDTPLPLVVDEEDKEVAEVADALLTPMGDGKDSSPAQGTDRPLAPESGTAGEDTAEVKGTSAQSTQPENLSPSEEPSGTAPEKEDKSVAVEPESKGEAGSLDSLFEQEEDEEESPLQGLIASLPDITVQEVLSAAEEVKGLIHEWQSGEPGEVPEDVNQEK